MHQAQANLLDAPEIWNRVAREENEGNMDLIDKDAAREGARRVESGLRSTPPGRLWPLCARSTSS